MTLLRAPQRPTATAPTRLAYWPGIDGLRAVSVAAVVAYHLDADWAVGGYLGVEVFFVVSGFLITSLLLAERRETGLVNQLAFWARRARRLLPAVYVLIAVLIAWALVAYDVGELRTIRGEAVASLFYVQNWHLIVTDVPYFAAFGRPSPFRHLWSLAIEEQFYLVWPLLIPALLRAIGRRLTGVALAVACIGSIAWLGHLGDIASPERAYYGTDTRLGGLLAGAVLAFWWRPEVARDTVRPAARALLYVVGAIATGGLLWILATRSEFDPLTFPWGFAAIDVLTVVLIVAVTHPAVRLSAIVGWIPLQAVGRRSYSIYLWHWPVIVSTRPGRDWELDGWTLLALRMVTIAALTEISYRLVERPFRERRAALAADEAAPSRVAVAPTGWVGIAVAAVLLGAVLVSAPGTATTSAFALERAPIATVTTTTTTTTAPTTTTTTTAVESTNTSTSVPAALLQVPRPVPDITLLGESVTLGAAPTLLEYYGERVQIDAVESRRYEDGIRLVEELAAAGRLTPFVIVHFGTNGAVPQGGMTRIVDAVGPDRLLVLVTVRVPQRWESQVNDEIRWAASQRTNIVIADWNALSHDEEGLLVDDGVHLTHQGMLRYRDLLVAITG